MSFFNDLIGGVASLASKAIEVAAPIALGAIFPPAAMLGPLSNLATGMLGSALGGAIGQMAEQCGIPKFVAKEAQNLLSGIVDKLLKPVDLGCMDHVADKAGGVIKDMVDEIVNQFKDALQNYKQEHADKCGGKGGKGGAGGAGGNGSIGFRELAAILADLEAKQAKNCANAASRASEALGVAKSTGTGENGKMTAEDEKKNAEIAANQFRAMEDNKVEAQIFQAVASAVSEVLKNFGGALNTSARAG